MVILEKLLSEIDELEIVLKSEEAKKDIIYKLEKIKKEANKNN